MRKASEMPEGVELSDGGDASDDVLAADDPHRALGDISLDDIEYTAPYKSKSDGSSRYENSFATSANGGVDGVPDDLFGGSGKAKAKKVKKAKKVEEVVAKDDEGGKKSKKSKKEKKEKKEKKKGRDGKDKDKSSDLHKGEIPGTDDVDFWLSNDVTAAK